MGVTGTIDLVTGGYNVNVVNRAPTYLPAATDRSGTITTAATTQKLADANTARMGLKLQNTSDTTMYFSENGAAASPTNGYMLSPGSSASVSTNRQINIYCATAGKTFAATEY